MTPLQGRCLLLSAMLAASACALNPQPIPPDGDDDSFGDTAGTSGAPAPTPPDRGSSSSSGGLAPETDAGFQGDGGAGDAGYTDAGDSDAGEDLDAGADAGDAG